MGDLSGHKQAGSNPATSGIPYVFDGGGSTLPVNKKGQMPVPFNCRITEVVLIAGPGQTGSIVIDIWKDTYANFPPTAADSICGSAKPTITSSNRSTDSTLAGWSPNLTEGDVLVPKVDSCSGLQNVTMMLRVVRT